MNKVIEHARSSATQTILFSKAVAPGVYMLKVTGGGTNIISRVVK